MRYKNNSQGFTIVELLIVIVVIAILAAISIVAFTGIQERAQVSSIQSALSQVNKTVKMHYAENGFYPISSAWSAQNNSTQDTFIPGLVPDYVNSLPRAPALDGKGTFYYRTNATGSEYKMLFLYPSTEALSDSVRDNQSVESLSDPIRPTRGWGYWSSGGAVF